jgi:hypothetical protein
VQTSSGPRTLFAAEDGRLTLPGVPIGSWWVEFTDPVRGGWGSAVLEILDPALPVDLPPLTVQGEGSGGPAA